MDGVSAVRAYTLIAVLAIVAGGWMLNEAPEADLMEVEMELISKNLLKPLMVVTLGNTLRLILVMQN